MEHKSFRPSFSGPENKKFKLSSFKEMTRKQFGSSAILGLLGAGIFGQSTNLIIYLISVALALLGLLSLINWIILMIKGKEHF